MALTTTKRVQARPEIQPRTDVQEAPLHSLEGTVQRLNYQKRELTVVSEGQLWHLEVAADCQVWFEGRLAPLRCCQPLDHVRIFYESQDTRHVAQILYAWQPQPA